MISDQALLFANTGLAYKPGGYVASTDLPNFFEFDRERLWANELGIKTRWDNDRVLANLSLFYYDIKDYQFERFLTPVDFIVINAPKVTSFGLEFELEAELLDGLMAEASFGYTHIEFDEYSDPATGEDLSGNKVPYVPEFDMMLATQYTHPLGFFARAELLWFGDVYYDDHNTNFLRENDYRVFNARVGYTGKWFSLYAFGNNLTDEEYFTFIVNSIPAGVPGAPRTAGIQLSAKF